MVQLQVRYNSHTSYYVYSSLFSAKYIAKEIIQRYPQVKVIYLIDRETGELLDVINRLHKSNDKKEKLLTFYKNNDIIIIEKRKE